ncbi:hypothetical protein PybrP1_004981 [[Pythium] brassicae (nom. inval.)]|nr:hypothetical protein PybrP1_004981 [[Pythium] brassicae (nom. inval.)]
MEITINRPRSPQVEIESATSPVPTPTKPKFALHSLVFGTSSAGFSSSSECDEPSRNDATACKAELILYLNAASQVQQSTNPLEW